VRFAGFTAENKDEYLKSAGDFYNKRCQNREKIAEYEKEHCETLDAIKRYPHTGVFHKDDPSRSLWFGGRCSGISYITSDAEYVVEMGPWAGHVEQMAFRICKRENLIAEYKISDLVDDESRLPRSVSHFRWREETAFDNKKATLFIKTLDNNEYTFDVRTGKILKHKFTPFKVFDAEVIYKNGERQQVHDVTSCSGMTFAFLLMGNGYPVHHLQVVEPVRKVNGGEMIQTGVVPFELIKNARFVSTAENQVIWNITTPQGKSEQVMLESSVADLCGNAADGKKVKMSNSDIDFLSLRQIVTPVSTAGKRTVEQRMSWDVNQWDKNRREVCENTPLVDYKSAREFRFMIRDYENAKCTELSVKFVRDMNSLNQWFMRQKVSEEMLRSAEYVAKFQLESGLPEQALDLYEYLLKEYQKYYSDRNKRKTYQNTYVLGQLLNASYQTGSLDKYEKFKKLFNVADAEYQKLQAEYRARQNRKSREKIRDYQQSLVNISIASISQDHEFPGKMKGTLQWECSDKEKSPIAAATDTYKTILELEKKLHPNEHIHVLKAVISLSDCYRKKKNITEAINSLNEALSLYLKMDKKGEFNSEKSLMMNREIANLAINLPRDERQVSDARIALDLRSIERYRESNNERQQFDTLSSLAMHYIKAGKYTEAEKCYRERVKLSAKLGGNSAKFAKADLERHYKFIKKLEQEHKDHKKEEHQ
jgi:tetratricopeptide (TPR) repeat protein